MLIMWANSFLNARVHAKALQSCLTLCDPMDYSPPGSSAHRIFRVRILKWVAMLSSKGFFWLRDQTCVSYDSWIGRWVLYYLWHLGSPICEYFWINVQMSQTSEINSVIYTIKLFKYTIIWILLKIDTCFN